MAERRAITETAAIRCHLASKRGKSRILDELCANTGWHRNHARKALTAALQPKITAPRSPWLVKYGPDVIAALTACWTVLRTPAGNGSRRCCIIAMTRTYSLINPAATQRFFSTLKYEHLYRGYIGDGDALDMEVHRFRLIYNTIRPHQALADHTPKRAYLNGKNLPTS